MVKAVDFLHRLDDMKKSGLYRITSLILIPVIFMTLTCSEINAGSYYENKSIPVFYSDKNKDLFNSIKGELPLGTAFEITTGNGKVPFNYRLWFDKNIVVYGDYSMCNTQERDFKSDTSDPSGNGYYEKDGIRGEYRYHGFDSSGNLYSNTMFTADTATTSSINDNNWLYRPWDPKTHALVGISPYNLAAQRNIYAHDIKTRSWLDRPITKGDEILTFENAENLYHRNASSYIHVMSAPSILYPGEGKAWHLYKDEIYYRTFTLDKLEHLNKIMPDMVATAEILSPPGELVVYDYMDLNTADYLNGEIRVDVKVKGLLLDEPYFDDEVMRAVYYTRYDIDSWDIFLLDQNITGLVSTDYNKCEAVFTLTLKRSSVIENKEILLSCRSRVNYLNGENYEKTGYANLVFDVKQRNIPVLKPDEDPLVIIIDDNKELPELLVPILDIPSIAFDTETFIPEDRTFMDPVISRKVYIDGALTDDVGFFGGSFQFGQDNTGLKRIDVIYEGANGDSVYVTEWVYVYSTRPRSRFTLKGEFKQNRKIILEQDCIKANIAPVLDEYPIVGYEWFFESPDEAADSLCVRDISNQYKEIMYKEPGKYRIGLVVENSIGIKSEPNFLDFIITEDIRPAVEINIWNGVLTRNEDLDIHYNVSSVDGDHIAEKSLRIYYDSNNDGEYDLLLKEFPNGEFSGFTPDKVGRYKISAWAKEEFKSETLMEFINEQDYRTKTMESEFLVDNLAPVTSIFIDAPINIPSADLLIMIDKNLNITATELLKSKRTDIANQIRALNIDSKVYIWDTKTYTYSEYVECAIAFGATYPYSNMNYSSGGYFGILDLYDVTNNRYYEDRGEFKIVSESRNFYREHENIVCDVYENYKLISSVESSPAPSSYYIDEDGFKGNIPRVDTRVNWQDVVKTYTWNMFTTSFSALYAGTLTKYSQLWVPNLVWKDEYTGYYRGTIYNSVSQNFFDPFRPTSDKFLLYFSDNGINYPEIYRNIRSLSDAKVILVGDETIMSQTDHDLFISKDKQMDEIFSIVAEFIGKDMPDVEKSYVLAGVDKYDIKIVNFDEERDRIISEEFKYLQDMNYFDNPMVTEPFANLSLDPQLGWINHKADTFINTGEFTVLRRIKDKPSENEAFDEYSYYSGTSSLKIYAHRVPVAKLDYRANYNIGTGMFEMEWICDSFDPDHEYSDPEKGIRERKMVYIKNMKKHYGMPEELPPGGYSIEYYVRDPEGVWSEPCRMNFILDEKAIHGNIDAKIKPCKDSISLVSFPASEFVEVYDIISDIQAKKLKISIIKSGGKTFAETLLDFESGKDTLNSDSIGWRNVVLKVPEVCSDGEHVVRIESIDEIGRSVFKEIIFNVNTPIGLKVDFPSLVAPEVPFEIKAETTEYVNSVTVTVFEGSLNEISRQLTGLKSRDIKEWQQSLTLLSLVPAGEFPAKFTAILPSGKQEHVIVPFLVNEAGEAEVRIEGFWNHWRGQIDAFGDRMSVQPHRFLGLEKVLVTVDVKGKADKIRIRFSPELERMVYVDKYGNKYDYKDDFGIDHVSFPREFELDPNLTDQKIQWEYILPLADSTLDWDNRRLKPPYFMEVTIISADNKTIHIIDDIDMTGNTTELTYIQ